MMWGLMGPFREGVGGMWLYILAVQFKGEPQCFGNSDAGGCKGDSGASSSTGEDYLGLRASASYAEALQGEMSKDLVFRGTAEVARRFMWSWSLATICGSVNRV